MKRLIIVGHFVDQYAVMEELRQILRETFHGPKIGLSGRGIRHHSKPWDNELQKLTSEV
jgi:hypothetical protein